MLCKCECVLSSKIWRNASINSNLRHTYGPLTMLLIPFCLRLPSAWIYICTYTTSFVQRIYPFDSIARHLSYDANTYRFTVEKFLLIHTWRGKENSLIHTQYYSLNEITSCKKFTMRAPYLLDVVSPVLYQHCVSLYLRFNVRMEWFDAHTETLACLSARCIER